MNATTIWKQRAFIVAISITLGILFDYLFWDKFPGVAFPVFIAIILAGFIGIAQRVRRPLNIDHYWLFPLLIFFAGMVAIRGNLLLAALNVLGCVLLLLLIVDMNVRGSVRKFVPFDYLILLFSPLKHIEHLFKTIWEFISAGKQFRNKERSVQIIRGILMTMPVIILLAILFSSADPVFGKYLALLNINVEPETMVRGIFIVIVSAVCIGAYSYAMFGATLNSAREGGRRYLGLIETTILLGSMNALFLAFIIIQFAYLFGGENNIISQGMTYAEYARRGFFELVAVAIISYLILLGTEKYIERNVEKHSLRFKYLSAALVLQVVVIMTSAFLRLTLYEDAYGFTTLRLYVHEFIFLLGVIFAFLVYKILVDNKENTFAFRTLLAIIVFLISMNLLDPDTFIARKNLERYAATGKIDPHYLEMLSSDAIEEKLKALQINDENARGIIGRSLYKTHVNNSSREHPWQSWNWSRENEREILEERAGELQQYKDYEEPSVP